jgi:hypothetical protein
MMLPSFLFYILPRKYIAKPRPNFEPEYEHRLQPIISARVYQT